MADSETFTSAARVIEDNTHLNAMQARGLVRLLLKETGLDARSFTPQQMTQLGRTMLEGALAKNGIADTRSVVEKWLLRAGGLQAPTLTDSVEEVFARMGIR